MKDLCYVGEVDRVTCNHFNNVPTEVILENVDGEKSGVCPICETKYVAKEVNK